jgi:predicted dehydrogenase
MARKKPARAKARSKPRKQRQRVRWAVVGQGYFAQSAILPAFAHARESCELVALFSGDEKKRAALAKRHRVAFALPYEELDDFLRSGEVQAVYLAVPNHLHRDYTLRAARAGVHVLCEKPMAVTTRECRDMIAACEDSRVKLMVAYRLHLEPANMTAVEDLRRGVLGDSRYYLSAFSFQIDDDNIRTVPTEQGGGPLYDIGTYCINAARYLFRAEPVEVVAMTARRTGDERFAHIDEQVSAILRFPDERLATFTVSFGAYDVSHYSVVGTEGTLRLDPAFSHVSPIELQEETERGSKRRRFGKHDQVAAELSYFARCILEDREPEPSGWEGFHDVRIIEAILESAQTGRKVALDLPERRQHPSGDDVIEKPPVGEPSLVAVDSPRD